MKHTVLLAAPVTLALLLASCGGGEAPVPTPSPTTKPPAATKASDLFAARCAACHGANRQGISGLGPALVPQRLAGRSDAELRDTIMNGRPGTAMPPWKGILTQQDIEAIVQFIKNTPP